MAAYNYEVEVSVMKLGSFILTSALIVGGIAAMGVFSSRKKDNDKGIHVQGTEPYEHGTGLKDRTIKLSRKLKKFVTEDAYHVEKNDEFSGINGEVPIKEPESVSDIPRKKPKEKSIPKQAHEPVYERTALEELQDERGSLASLAVKSDMIIKSDTQGRTPESILRSWENTLDMCNCLMLNKAFLQIKIAAEKTGDSPTKTLSDWMGYLKYNLNLYERESGDENGCIVVDSSNRAEFDNGSEFKDGEICKVIANPWMLGESLYYGGLLEKYQPKTETGSTEPVEPYQTVTEIKQDVASEAEAAVETDPATESEVTPKSVDAPESSESKSENSAVEAADDNPQSGEII